MAITDIHMASNLFLEQAERLASFLTRYRRVLVLTGAGISTASGIPAYRGDDGVRRGKAPIQGPDFRSNEGVRKRYWSRSMAGWPVMAQASPNAAHRALASLQQAGRVADLITQNVDGLHTRAGCSDVLELHGNLARVFCLQCGASHARSWVQGWLEQANGALAGMLAQPAPDGDAQLEMHDLAGFHIPACPHCDGVLQPDVVFFGDLVPRHRTVSADRMLRECDAVLAVGSSLMVHSGFRLVRSAHEAGKPVVSLNLGVTRADALLSLKIDASAEQVLPQVAALLGEA